MNIPRVYADQFQAHAVYSKGKAEVPQPPLTVKAEGKREQVKALRAALKGWVLRALADGCEPTGLWDRARAEAAEAAAKAAKPKKKAAK